MSMSLLQNYCTARVGFGKEKPLLQLRVFRLGLLQDGNVGVGVLLLPQSYAANQRLKTHIGMKLVKLRIDVQIDHILITFPIALFQ